MHTNDHLARLEGARFTGACAAVTNPRGSPSSPVLLVARAAAGALHAPEFTKLKIILIQWLAAVGAADHHPEVEVVVFQAG